MNHLMNCMSDFSFLNLFLNPCNILLPTYTVKFDELTHVWQVEFLNLVSEIFYKWFVFKLSSYFAKGLVYTDILKSNHNFLVLHNWATILKVVMSVAGTELLLTIHAQENCFCFAQALSLSHSRGKINIWIQFWKPNSNICDTCRCELH